MTIEQKLVERTFAAGSYGIKKTDLRKEFGEPLDAALEATLAKGLVFVEKRGGAYYCWHKDYYIQSLLNSDARFKISYDMIKAVQESLRTSTIELSRSINVLSGNISNLSKLIVEGELQKPRYDPTQTESIRGTSRSNLGTAEFQKEFDRILAENSSSIGWVELAKIKNDICNKYGISGDEFYRQVSDITLQQQNKYELSTGGGEGVMVRGLLHGFVRCI